VRRPLGSVLVVAAAAAVFLSDATALSGQSTESVVAQRRLEYTSASDTHQAALSAFRVVEQRFSAALTEVERARREGDDVALSVALPRAQNMSVPKADRARRVSEAAEDLAEKRQALIDVLVVRQAELVGRLDAAASAVARQQQNDLLDDTSNELSELEDEAEDPTGLLPVVMPNIEISPRDLPAEIESKAQIFERTAAVVDTVLLENAEQIADLEDRLRIERQRQDFLVNADRFGDRQVPTGPPRVDPTVEVSDSTDAEGRPITLEERLAEAQAYREELTEYRDQLLIRARVFRQAIRVRS